MKITLAFDVYGTLIDTNGIVVQLQNIVGNKAKAFSQTWRDKQLEYSFRRGLMQNYVDFSVCTSNALDYSCDYYKVLLTREEKQNLLNYYRTLPAFADVKAGLTALQSNHYRNFAFSNGNAETVEALLVAAGIREYFLGIVSVDDIQSFKPNPAVYSHFMRKSETSCCGAWLISSNPFDVIGAVSAGMRAAWVRRSEDAIFDPWEINPTLIVENLHELHEKISDYIGIHGNESGDSS